MAKCSRREEWGDLIILKRMGRSDSEMQRKGGVGRDIDAESGGEGRRRDVERGGATMEKW